MSRPTARAFTLIEVTVVIALFVVMMVAVIRFFTTYSSSFLYSRSMMSVSSSAGNVVNDVTEYGLSADQVESSHTFGATNYTSSASTLILELPSVDASGVVLPSSYDYVVYYKDGAYVYRTLEAGAGSTRRAGTKLLSDAVSSLVFDYATTTPANATSVNVSVTTQKSPHGQSVQSKLGNTIYLRNK